jgi:hypothetical protein
MVRITPWIATDRDLVTSVGGAAQVGPDHTVICLENFPYSFRASRRSAACACPRFAAGRAACLICMADEGKRACANTYMESAQAGVAWSTRF